ncbi:MAG: hypothetical protein IJP61_07505 [Treponema sp.]|nr:hypothetical protein [Treponema sp.]
MTTDVYSQYFAADCIFCGVARHAALVSLTVDSEGGRVSYSVSASFFPHTDEDDFSVSYDAFVSKIVYEGTGRRSKKREKNLIESLRPILDEISASISGSIIWDKPLRPARYG